MSQDKIHPYHLERIAFAYLRQSTPGQVKHNLEGRERQLRMPDIIQQWGWPKTLIRLLQGDTAHSGTSLHGRDDFRIMEQAVLERTAGLIAASELSRLVRDNEDWNRLVRLCRYHRVLLADERRVYDPADPQDRVMLGIQSAFFEFEWTMITDRMQGCLRQKAERGEHYDSFPPGYVCRQGTLYEKHPDERVQRAVAQVFVAFAEEPSVHALHRRLRAEKFQLPVVPHGADWRDVQWREPSYGHLLGMLKNPTYGGVYARGKQKTYAQLDADGHVMKKRKRVPRDEWDVFLPGHHDGYIDQATWERNLQKIAGNAQATGKVGKRAPASGAALLAGVLRCRRCGSQVDVAYSGRSNEPHYVCRGGRRQRDAERQTCFSMAARNLDRVVSGLLLEALRPAGLEAAQTAARQFREDHQQRRQLLMDQVTSRQEVEARAAREYKSTDATYLAIRQKLAGEWDVALQAVRAAEERLAQFDQRTPEVPTTAQWNELCHLATRVDQVWWNPSTSMILKKRIARTLIEEIIVDLDRERTEAHVWVHGSGGHHTELRVLRRGVRPRVKVDDLRAVIETLRKVLPDESIATTLNRSGMVTATGDGWTKQRVAAFRRKQGIAAYSESQRQREGWLTQEESATRAGVSPMSIHRLVEAAILPAERPQKGMCGVIRASDLELPEVQRALHRLKTSKTHPLPADPNQLMLVFSDGF